jgi:hypothetical protein
VQRRGANAPTRHVFPAARPTHRFIEYGATDNLHFDHDLPFSVGGSSLTAKNIRLLCARHNLEKSNKIQ